MKYVMFILCLLTGFVVRSQTSKVGDVITNPDGSQGVVFWLYPDGSGGWMVALYDVDNGKNFLWGDNTDIPGLENKGEGMSAIASFAPALADVDGYGNTTRILAVQGEGTSYAAQVVDSRNGWYIPSPGQMRRLFSAWPIVENVIREASGNGMKSPFIYWTSSEASADYAWSFNFQYGYLNSWNKSQSAKIRPVRSFVNKGIEYDTTLMYKWNTGHEDPFIQIKPARTKNYQVVATSREGCSTTASQRVFVQATGDTTIHATICRGETYTQEGFHVSDAGVYVREIEGGGGCKIKITLVLSVIESIKTTLPPAKICKGEVYSKHNFLVWEAGHYEKVWNSASGCDSVVVLNLTVNPSYHVPLSASVCEGHVYNANGFHVSESGYYTLPLKTKQGCDSIITLDLTVKPVHSVTLYDTVCEGVRYMKNGFDVSVAGTYVLNLTNQAGCDSIVTLHLAAHPIRQTFLQASICKGESYVLNGFNESEPGVYVHHFNSINGCDSIVTLNLMVRPVYLFEQSASICEGNIYDFRGQMLTDGGVYYDVLQSVDGCDSIYQLSLVVNPVYDKTFEGLVCEGERYLQNGFDESATGSYTHRLQTVAGCDSVVKLNLFAEPYFEGDFNISLLDCRNHEYRFLSDPENSSAGSVYHYSWNLGNGDTAEQDNIKYSYPDSGSYEIELTVKTAKAGCEKRIRHSLQVPYYAEDIEIYSDRTEVGDDAPQIMFWTDCFPGMRYKWDLGDGTISDACEVRHTYKVDDRGSYHITLWVMNADDCPVERSLEVLSYETIHTFNTFSPNGDGLNDVFMPEYSIKILNRNGLVIFEGENGWDGTYKGRSAPEDTYFYEIRYRMELGDRVKTGYITLKR